ncbi:glycoside hydrolase family 76 protein [Pseudarthrobacter niigatensis]|uniref:Alpha-1,6-mannanase (GH76 family) n=1 Tax=Pseudarthrobacter niigatensis TaxID=369935 RepID=A0AAJ1SSY2_9MICC|nr:glycoside hydrolase family 76 protein [Pseudarthrobacter niigatensis]MDQ0146651.1 putative alpha-1,6-mannanase (GH76 family) [Pseudarthrobacter niigatensis]MDQ0266816.1 putative alpha-1,6-mannanase (GH76 family) [Pseudarthrobacter niigatensis]
MTSSSTSLTAWQDRANHAARSVTALFGRKLLFLPGTHLGAVLWQGRHPAGPPTPSTPEQEPGTQPAPRWRTALRRMRPAASLALPWHYWWQAHYVDCLVDAGRRELGGGATPAARFDGPGRPSAGHLASRLVTGIRLRNALTFVNSYYDDMAWLALATLRLDRLAEETRRPGRRRNAVVRASLALQFDAACTDDLGGGTFWSKKRDFKNTPATAPVALFYARTGHQPKAQALLDWLDTTLFDADQALYLDGARLDPSGEVVLERAVYTYNQGPVLGALLELGGEANLGRVAVLVDAVQRLLTVPGSGNGAGTGSGGSVLRCEGTGDGGLFTGILCRYLALAAADRRLPAATRATAARLVTDTAEALWSGRRPVGPGEANARRQGTSIFSLHAAKPAAATYPPGAAVELSTQLQAWMALEAAAAVTAAAGA